MQIRHLIENAALTKKLKIDPSNIIDTLVALHAQIAKINRQIINNEARIQKLEEELNNFRRRVIETISRHGHKSKSLLTSLNELETKSKLKPINPK